MDSLTHVSNSRLKCLCGENSSAVKDEKIPYFTSAFHHQVNCNLC